MSNPTRERPGLPDQTTVVREITFQPMGRSTDVLAAPRVYRVLRTNQVDLYDEPLAESELDTLGAERSTGDDFCGTARRVAKISIADAPTEVFADIADLIATLPEHAVMVERVPPIKTGPRAKRVAEEERNVRVRAFLYAASREDDNDYHLIVGRDPVKSPMYMTMEVSGLPTPTSPYRARLRDARDAYTAFFGDDLPGASYDFYDPPIEIEVEGSLFFDCSHATGSRPGPRDLRPDMPVVWEIHPISRITLEP